ncbi:MAG: hypothetical protein H0V25_07210 [Solirubrobacterales bacterium]|nr:hypothetical protein [Solirubrobacterales bacterium]
MGKGLIFGIVIVVIAIAAIAGLLYRPATVIGASGKSLAYSLRSEAGSDRANCEGADDDFDCVLATQQGAVRYRVSVDKYGCWTAEQTQKDPAGGASAELSRCITIADLIRSDD